MSMARWIWRGIAKLRGMKDYADGPLGSDVAAADRYAEVYAEEVAAGEPDHVQKTIQAIAHAAFLDGVRYVRGIEGSGAPASSSKGPL